MILDLKKEYSCQDMLALLEEADLREEGVYKNLLSTKFKNFMDSKKQGKTLVLALNNADISYAANYLIEEKKEIIFEVTDFLSDILGFEKKLFYLANVGGDFSKDFLLMAKEKDIDISFKFLDVRKHEDDFILHILSTLDIYDILNKIYKNGKYISVNGSAIRKYDLNMKISDIFKENSIDLGEIKAFEAGYSYYPKANLDESLETVPIENNILNSVSDSDCSMRLLEEKMLKYRAKSCAKCVFCREGLVQLQEMSKDIIEGKGKREYIDIAREIGQAMIFSNLCSLGQKSSQFLLSGLTVFNEEYEDHIKKKNCKAGFCFNREVIYIDPQRCEGCEDCVDICPEDCIEGKSGFIHMIDEFDCTLCGKCIDVCEYEAIIKTNDKPPKLPDRLTKCGRFRKR